MSNPSKKRKNSYYFATKKQKVNDLTPGLKGFLCFCNFREKDCLKEAFNLLDEYINKFNLDATCVEVEKKLVADSKSSDDEIEDELSKEIADVKTSTKKANRFQIVESGAKNILFLSTTLDDPVNIANVIMKDVFETKEKKSRFLLRLVPIEYTCKANISDVQKHMGTLIDKYFSNEPKTFSVVYNHRNNNSLNRDEVIKELADFVGAKNEKHKVNLKEPDLALVVEVIRGMCLLSVVPDYNKYKKYNLHQLSDNANIEMKKNDNTGENMSKEVENTEESKTEET